MLDTNMVQYVSRKNARVLARYEAVRENVYVSGIVVEEIIVSGFIAELNNIRSGGSRGDLERTYNDFHQAIDELAKFEKLPYTPRAEAIFKSLKSGKGSAKVKGMDGRIAAHAVSLGMILVTESVADFENVSGLAVENWAR